MTKSMDARTLATRELALEAALEILQTDGVLAVTHASISARSGISRSTLYRHWPKLNQVRTDAFKRASKGTNKESPSVRTKGPLKEDLAWLLGYLMVALNDMPWGQIAPQVIAAAATDEDARRLINDWIKQRSANVEEVFNAAIERKEISGAIPLESLVEMAIGVLYFRKLVAGQTLDHDWLDNHVDLVCSLATTLSYNT